MRQIGAIVLAVGFLLIFVGLAKAQNLENAFGVGIVAGAIEVPYNFLKNLVTCSSVWDCINIPKHFGKGAINGSERIIGTTILPGKYSRVFGKNSELANNKIASSVIGGALLGWALTGADVFQFGDDAIFSINQNCNAGIVLGTLVGTGTGIVDAAIDQNLYDKE